MSQPISFSDSQVTELARLIVRFISQSELSTFQRVVSRVEYEAPWFVWVALANDGTELGRSDEFRFVAANVRPVVTAQTARDIMKGIADHTS